MFKETNHKKTNLKELKYARKFFVVMLALAIVSSLLILPAPSLVLAQPNDADAYPQYKRDVTRAAYSSNSSSPNTNRTQWQVDLGASMSTCIVADRTVFTYVYSPVNSLVALNADTGEKKWSYALPTEKIRGSQAIYAPSYYDGKIYAMTAGYEGTSTIYCWNATTGAKIWNYTLEYGQWESGPLVFDGKLITRMSTPPVFPGTNSSTMPIANKTTVIICLDANTAAPIWRYDTNRTSFGATIGMSYDKDDNLVLVHGRAYIYAVDATTGRFVWEYKVGSQGGIASGEEGDGHPVYSNGAVYYMGYNGSLDVLNATTGKFLVSGYNPDTGKTATNLMKYGSPAVGYSKMFTTSLLDNSIRALQQGGGIILWTYKTGGPVPGGASLSADGKVFTTSIDKCVYCLDQATGKLIWKYQTPNTMGATPAIAYGRAYVGGDAHILYCFADALPSSLALNVSPRMVYGDHLSISGKLADGNNTGVGGLQLSVKYLFTPAVESQSIGNVTTASDGTYSLTWTPPSEGIYQIEVSYAGDGYAPATQKSYVTVVSPPTSTVNVDDIVQKVLAGIPNTDQTTIAILAFVAATFAIGVINLYLIRKRK